MRIYGEGRRSGSNRQKGDLLSKVILSYVSASDIKVVRPQSKRPALQLLREGNPRSEAGAYHHLSPPPFLAPPDQQRDIEVLACGFVHLIRLGWTTNKSLVIDKKGPIISRPALIDLHMSRLIVDFFRKHGDMSLAVLQHCIYLRNGREAALARNVQAVQPL